MLQMLCLLPVEHCKAVWEIVFARIPGLEHEQTNLHLVVTSESEAKRQRLKSDGFAQAN
jgi:hypothetical protein